jgi:hypothetical protein
MATINKINLVSGLKSAARNLKYGICIGEGKNNGIKVYEDMNLFNNQRILTSLGPDGKIRKEITTTVHKPQKSKILKAFVTESTTKVLNFVNDTKTIIDKKLFTPLKKSENKFNKPLHIFNISHYENLSKGKKATLVSTNDIGTYF